jgi:hypothetical protein
MNIPEEVRQLIIKLKTDKKLYRAWRQDMAESFVEQYILNSINEPVGFIYCPTLSDIESIANDGAEGFLKMLINLENGEE